MGDFDGGITGGTFQMPEILFHRIKRIGRYMVATLASIFPFQLRPGIGGSVLARQRKLELDDGQLLFGKSGAGEYFLPAGIAVKNFELQF